MSVNPPPPPGSFPGPPPGYSPPPPPPYQQAPPPPAYGQPPVYDQPPTYGQAPAAPPPKKNWLPWVAGGCGCLLLGAAIVAGILFFAVRAGTAGAEEVVKGFLKAAGEERYAEAYDYFSAPLKETKSYEDFRAESAAAVHLFRVKDTTFNERSVDTSSAKLAGTVTLESGTVLPAEFRLVKENDAWKLIGYSIASGE